MGFAGAPTAGGSRSGGLDQTAIRPFYLLNQDSLYPSLVPVRYPKPGTPNSDVKIGVVEISTGRTSWIELGPDKDIYVAAMDFADAPDQLWLTRLKPAPESARSLMADATSGAARVIMTDADSAWVDANQPRWIDGGKTVPVRLRARRQRSGLPVRSGRLVGPARDAGGWDVQDVYGVDEKTRVLYFSGAIEGPLGRQLLRVGWTEGGWRGFRPTPGRTAPRSPPRSRCTSRPIRRPASPGADAAPRGRDARPHHCRQCEAEVRRSRG